MTRRSVAKKPHIEEENQQTEVADPEPAVDEAFLAEERRRRREAIKAKHRVWEPSSTNANAEVENAQISTPTTVTAQGKTAPVRSNDRNTEKYTTSAAALTKRSGNFAEPRGPGKAPQSPRITPIHHLL